MAGEKEEKKNPGVGRGGVKMVSRETSNSKKEGKARGVTSQGHRRQEGTGGEIINK